MATDRLVKHILLSGLALAVSVIPTVAAILLYFPVWIAEGGEAVLCGATVLLLAIAALPIYRLVRERMKSPAIWTLWLIAFVIFLLLANIADEMTVICFVGFVSNLIGAVLFRLDARSWEQKNESV